MTEAKPERRGGFRANAKRPVLIPDGVKVEATVPRADRDAIDSRVGKRHRAEFIRQAVAEKLRRDSGTHPVGN